MRINKIHLENFRCFDNYNILFAEKATVIIGKNGTGKTTLISALRKGLSFMFAKSQSFSKSLSESNNCNVRSFSLWDSRFDLLNRAFSFPIQNNFEAVYNGEIIRWSALKKKDPGSLHPTLYKHALDSVLSNYNADLKNSDLPLVAYFSDSYPHVISNVGEKASKLAKMDVLPRDFGYYGWDEETNCAELWQRRYIKATNFTKDLKDDIEKIVEQIEFYQQRIYNKDEQDENKISEWEERIEELKERLEYLNSSNSLNEEFSKEKYFIDEKIYIFTRPLKNDLNFINQEFQVNRVSVNRPDKVNNSIEFSFNDGRTMHFEILPAGYKRLLSIVFDIAYRSYILNQSRVTKGIVIIDEIELHLHPTLQQDVIERLSKTFPDIQFIVSTHSPLVISNLNADDRLNKIIKLEHDGDNYSNEAVENVFGIDYSTNLSEIMEVSPRSSTIDKLINAYLVLFGKNKDKEADLMLNKLRDYLGGEIPALLQKEIDNQKKAYQ